MNKLWVRFSLAFGVVTIIGLILAAMLATWQVGAQFRRFVADNQMTDPMLLDALTEHYARNQSWRGVETIFEARRRSSQPPPPDSDRRQPFWRRFPPLNLILADPDGRVVYDRPGNGRPRLTTAEIDQAVPIEWHDEIVGHLLVKPPGRADLSGAALSFLLQVNRSLLQAGLIAGGLGILLGLTIARGLTAPLGQLAAAARRISQGKLDQKVPVKGPAEVADLASAFNDMSTALEEAETLRRNLIADVAHELRTPLSVLQGNLRAILDDVYALDKAEVARLYDQTRLLNRLINDLHELAQAEAHQLPLNLQPTDLADLVTTTADTFASVAEGEGVILKTALAPNVPTVSVDGTRLRQVLHNLLINALRHTPVDGVITLSLKPEPSQVCLTVADTGDGIPPEHLPYVFDRFYRADRARSRDRGGAGLGLAIARAIVEAHGGQVGVTSDGIPGHGSTFTIALPVT